MQKTSSRRLKKFVAFEDLIIFEDESLVVVDKPLYMSSLHDKEMRHIQGMSQAYNPELSLCHRLDKMTSGVLVLAKGAENYRSISLQFQKREVRKYYKTIVAGIHQFDDFVIEKPLMVSTNKKVSISREGKPSKTLVHTEKHFVNFSVLRCEPVTGRMHQIRAHLSSMGCPIVGDHLYGGEDIYLSRIKRKYKPSGRREEQPVNHGYLLHAQKLSLEHPTSGERLEFEAPYPKNFSVVLKVLEKYNS